MNARAQSGKVGDAAEPGTAEAGGKVPGQEGLVARLERGMPWLLCGWAVGLFAFIVLFTEALGLDEGARSAAPLVFLLSVATATLLVTALVLAVRRAVSVGGMLRLAWISSAVLLLMASIIALAHLTVDTGDYEGEGCHRWAILPPGTFAWMAWVPWPAWAGLGLALGAISLPLLVFRTTRRPASWLLGAFLLGFLLTLGALDGCPDL